MWRRLRRRVYDNLSEESEESVVNENGGGINGRNDEINNNETVEINNNETDEINNNEDNNNNNDEINREMSAEDDVFDKDNDKDDNDKDNDDKDNDDNKDKDNNDNDRRASISNEVNQLLEREKQRQRREKELKEEKKSKKESQNIKIKKGEIKHDFDPKNRIVSNDQFVRTEIRSGHFFLPPSQNLEGFLNGGKTEDISSTTNSPTTLLRLSSYSPTTVNGAARVRPVAAASTAAAASSKPTASSSLASPAAQIMPGERTLVAHNQSVRYARHRKESRVSRKSVVSSFDVDARLPEVAASTTPLSPPKTLLELATEYRKREPDERSVFAPHPIPTRNMFKNSTLD